MLLHNLTQQFPDWAEVMCRLDGGLFAASLDVSSSVNRWFRHSSSFSQGGFWGLIVLAIIGLWVGLYLWDRSRRPRKRKSVDAEGLFLQLCDLHNLPNADRQLLRTIASSQKLSQPGQTFVDPRFLVKHAQRHPDSKKQVQDLMNRIYGEALLKEIIEHAQAQPA